MKKSYLHIFALAAVLTGCSAESDVATNDNNSDNLQPIALSVVAPSQVSTTRGTGTVGSDNADNCWEGQKVRVYMFNKGTLTLTKMDETRPDGIYDNAELITPIGEVTGPLVREDNRRCYYPVSGQSDFWGYRTDGAESGTPRVVGNQMQIPFKIDGSQDLLLGAPDRSTWPTDPAISKYYYSAYSAHNDATFGNPTLVFAHQLTRFAFTAVSLNNIKEYSENATQISSSEVEMDINWTKVQSDVNRFGSLNLGVYVDAIMLESPTTGSLIIADTETNKQGIVWNQDSKEFLELQKRDGKAADDLKPMGTFQVSDKDVKSFGEALLVAPQEKYQLKVIMHQYKLKYSPEYIKTHSIARPYVYTEVEWLLPNFIDLKKINAEAAGKPGYSYTIKLGVSGVEPILLNATLEPWISGGEGAKPLE